MTQRPWRATAASIAAISLVGMVFVVVAPWFASTDTYGFHDWDVARSFRYLVKVSLLEHGEWPSWNAYACGGYPSWGYYEGATNLVSPWLPAYLLLPLPWAIRIEAAGMGLLGAFGAYAIGSCFTKSHGARLLVAALWAVNGRWGLQIASGHTWHLAYAYLPWCAFFFERARRPNARLHYSFALGGCFALMVYAGGIYPLPHAVLALGLYALFVAAADKQARPLRVLLVSGIIGVGLSAPKLLPMLDVFASDPRIIESRERLDIGAFITLLTHPEQPFHARPAPVRPYGWHEWGMYISAWGVALLAYALLFVRGKREIALRLTGLLFLLLGFGAFHSMAPWSLLHEHVPVFKSQHVPSRFLYPAVLLLAVVAASGIGRWVDRRRRRWPWLDAVLAAAVSLLAIDIAQVAQQPMRQSMWMVAPDIPPGRSFHFEREPPFQYVRRDWAGPMLLSMMANTGVLNCYGVPRQGWQPAALAHDDPAYRGVIWLDGPGRVEQISWTPNHIRVRVHDSEPGTLLIYNMNHRAGWAADRGQVRAHQGLVAVPIQGDGELTFRYRPPGFGTGVGLFALTLVAVGFVWRRKREEEV